MKILDIDVHVIHIEFDVAKCFNEYISSVFLGDDGSSLAFSLLENVPANADPTLT